jgi:nicotinamide-nucleotide amidase
MLLETGEKFHVVLPGPPRELKPMFEQYVLPKLREKAGEICVKRRILRVAGMGESAVDEKIAPIYKQYANPQTTILFNRSEIEIHLTAQAKNEPEADALIEEVAAKIAETLGASVFALDGEKMEEVIGKLLSDGGKTLSLAESCTGGLIAQRLTEISGSSKYFIEGVVAYANEAKIRTLNVPAELIEAHGAVSAEVAEAMAKGIRARAQTDYAISITGIAGPTGGSEEKPVGLVFIGYADESQTKSFKIILPGDRELIRWRASQAALEYLRRKILQKNPD